jgi:hypothetical protein
LVKLGHPLQTISRRKLYPGSFIAEERPIKIKTSRLLITLYGLAVLLGGLWFVNSSVVNRWLSREKQAEKRIKVLKLDLAIIVLFLLFFGNSEFYSETDSFLYSSLWLPTLTERQLWMILTLVRVNLVLWVIDYCPQLTGPVFIFSWTLYQYYTTCFSTSYWITNTHISIFAVLFCLPKEYQTPVVNFCRTYVAVMYFQAGLSKLLIGGLKWFLTGRRIWTEALLLGTSFGRYLVSCNPGIFMPLGWLTGILELMLSPLLLTERYSYIIALLAIGFHVGTFAILGISFWFIALFYLALFE